MDLCIVNMLSLSEAGVDLDKDKELSVSLERRVVASDLRFYSHHYVGLP